MNCDYLEKIAVLYFRIYYVLHVRLVYLALWGSVVQHPTSVTCLVIVTSSCRLRTIRRVMWRHDLSPMQWQQSVICFGDCGSACSPRDRLGQSSLTSVITAVCVSLLQESNYSRKPATSARDLDPSLTLQNVMIPCTDNEFDFRLTLRLLMSYVYGAPILDVSRSHTTTQHSR